MTASEVCRRHRDLPADGRRFGALAIVDDFTRECLALVANAFAESFNGRMRDELLNEGLFFGLNHARTEIAAWITDYNTERPHSALGYRTPAAFAATLVANATAATGRSAAVCEASTGRPVAQSTIDSVSIQKTLPRAG